MNGVAVEQLNADFDVYGNLDDFPSLRVPAANGRTARYAFRAAISVVAQFRDPQIQSIDISSRAADVTILARADVQA